MKHFRARRVMKRDVPGTARLMGRGTAVLECALPLLGVRVDFVQRCGSALREGAMLALIVRNIPTRWLRFTSYALFIVQDISDGWTSI